ncbi:MAG: hypothetical protein QGG64_07245 [Candidatus Latescibacteria bacterium]|jgi:hypothetical protein|nr:hypothetical protein [Candidatus Latescibacterota bacterium]|tara:strand:- start:461 stop:679 length:219 start_codon:yes stop_codon:yes gene_type:complete
MTKKKFKAEWLDYFCQFTEEEISAMVVGVTALRTMELWPHFVDHCAAKMNEDMAAFTNELLEEFDEDSAPIH